MKIPGLRISLVALLWLVALPASAATYRSADNLIQTQQPLGVCRLKPFSFQLARYGQVFRGVVIPNLTLIPCERYEPVAFFGGIFRAFKETGDRTEACTGDASVRISEAGRVVDMTLVNRGSLPGHYCRDRNRTLRYRLLRRG